MAPKTELLQRVLSEGNGISLDLEGGGDRIRKFIKSLDRGNFSHMIIIAFLENVDYDEIDNPDAKRGILLILEGMEKSTDNLGGLQLGARQISEIYKWATDKSESEGEVKRETETSFGILLERVKTASNNDFTLQIYYARLGKIDYDSIEDSETKSSIDLLIQEINDLGGLESGNLDAIIAVFDRILELYSVYLSSETAREVERLKGKTRAEAELNLKQIINEIKEINLDFEVKYESWEDFKERVLSKIPKDTSPERKKEIENALEQQIRPMVESMILSSNEINLTKIGSELDSLLDRVSEADENPDGSIEIDLNDSGEGIRGLFGELYDGAKGLLAENFPGAIAAPFEYENGIVKFGSKQEAILLIRDLKTYLSQLKAFYKKAFNGIAEYINNGIENLLGATVLAAGGLFIDFHIFYGELIMDYVDIITETAVNGNWLGLILAVGTGVGGVIALNKSLDFAKSGIDRTKVDEMIKHIKELGEIYKEAGMEKEAHNIFELYKDIRSVWAETPTGQLANYKQLGVIYRLLQTWRGTEMGDFLRGQTAWIGDQLDNGALLRYPIGEDGKRMKGFIRFLLDMAILPDKLFILFVNRGPNGGLLKWRIQNKSRIVLSFSEEFDRSLKRFRYLFDSLAKIKSIDKLKISDNELKQLKASILREYKSRIIGSKLDPLSQNRLGFDGKIPVLVNIDEIVADKIDEFLRKKFSETGHTYRGSSDLPFQLKQFMSEVRNSSDTFEQTRKSIDKQKAKYLSFIEYFPEIADDVEERLKIDIEIIASISTTDNDFNDRVNNLLNSEKAGLSSEVKDFLSKLKNNLGIEINSVRGDKVEIEKTLLDMKNNGLISSDEYNSRVAKVKELFSVNRKLWGPHYVEIVNIIIAGKDYSTITMADINEVNNRVDSLLLGIETDNKALVKKLDDYVNKERLSDWLKSDLIREVKELKREWRSQTRAGIIDEVSLSREIRSELARLSDIGRLNQLRSIIIEPSTGQLRPEFGFLNSGGGNILAEIEDANTRLQPLTDRVRSDISRRVELSRLENFLDNTKPVLDEANLTQEVRAGNTIPSLDETSLKRSVADLISTETNEVRLDQLRSIIIDTSTGRLRPEFGFLNSGGGDILADIQDGIDRIRAGGTAGADTRASGQGDTPYDRLSGRKRQDVLGKKKIKLIEKLGDEIAHLQLELYLLVKKGIITESQIPNINKLNIDMLGYINGLELLDITNEKLEGNSKGIRRMRNILRSLLALTTEGSLVISHIGEHITKPRRLDAIKLEIEREFKSRQDLLIELRGEMDGKPIRKLDFDKLLGIIKKAV